MNKWLLGLVVLAAGVGVGWYVLQAKPKEEMTKFTGEQNALPTQKPARNASASVTGGENAATDAGTSASAVTAFTTVTYSDTGFAPKTVTVKKGATARFVSTATGGMWVASAVHPTHQLLPGFDQLKSVGNGGTYDYAFVKVGTWKYHNHVNPSDTGSVVVTE